MGRGVDPPIPRKKEFSSTESTRNGEDLRSVRGKAAIYKSVRWTLDARVSRVNVRLDHRSETGSCFIAVRALHGTTLRLFASIIMTARTSDSVPKQQLKLYRLLAQGKLDLIRQYTLRICCLRQT